MARIGHRATRDVLRTREEQVLREVLHFRPRRGRRRLKLNVSEARQDITMLVISWGPEHQDLTYVYSGSAVRIRSACYGRPDPHAHDVSVVCTIKEAKW